MWFERVPSDAIRSTSSEPLHRQLSGLIRSAIADGELSPGAHLPTETELQQRFGISRSVVRQALASLANDGLLQRGRGRGTVVAPLRGHHRAVHRVAGLLSQITEPDQVVSTEVLKLAAEPDAQAAGALGTDRLIALERLRSVNDAPIALISTWLPADLVPGLRRDDLTNASLHELLRVRYGIPVSAGHRQIRAVAASDRLASRLATPVGAPLLVLEGTSLDDAGRSIEFFRTWHRADEVVFDVDANGRGGFSPQHAPVAAAGAAADRAIGIARAPGPDADAHASVAPGASPAQRARLLAAALDTLATDLETSR